MGSGLNVDLGRCERNFLRRVETVDGLSEGAYSLLLADRAINFAFDYNETPCPSNAIYAAGCSRTTSCPSPKSLDNCARNSQRISEKNSANAASEPFSQHSQSGNNRRDQEQTASR